MSAATKPPEPESTMSHIALASRLARFASSIGLDVDVLDDGRGGFVTRGAGDAGGILLGSSERSARATLRRLVER